MWKQGRNENKRTEHPTSITQVKKNVVKEHTVQLGMPQNTETIH